MIDNNTGISSLGARLLLKFEDALRPIAIWGRAPASFAYFLNFIESNIFVDTSIPEFNDLQNHNLLCLLVFTTTNVVVRPLQKVLVAAA